ncbi:MAG: hypothetical protein E2P05_02240 [Acidobacteria bacterium]|nr:MAG: hypothetical protein E2P05_02240 [Acidobacteriota bacterium]
MKGKFYQGRRRDNSIVVHVKEERGTWFKPLPHISYHSPDGFEWGYGGSGPADLALAILTDFFNEKPHEVRAEARKGRALEVPSSAVHFHQQFKEKFIVGLPKAGWKITEEQIKEWIAKEIGALCKDCKRGMYESDGCRKFVIPMKNGTTVDPIKHGKETRADWGRDGHRCHDCGAKVGHYHHPGCDVEECPGCGGQLIGCECVLYDEDEESIA